jgi:integrase
MDASIQEYLKFPKFNHEYIFPSFNNMSKPISPARWKAIFREKCLKNTGRYIRGTNKTIPRTRSYSMRASYALRLIEKGVPPKEVMASLGHSDWRSFLHYVSILSLKGKNLNVVRKASSYLD